MFIILSKFFLLEVVTAPGQSILMSVMERFCQAWRTEWNQTQELIQSFWLLLIMKNSIQVTNGIQLSYPAKSLLWSNSAKIRVYGGILVNSRWFNLFLLLLKALSITWFILNQKQSSDNHICYFRSLLFWLCYQEVSSGLCNSKHSSIHASTFETVSASTDW